METLEGVFPNSSVHGETFKHSSTEIVSFYQYPLPRYQYCKTVGEVGEHTVAWIFQTIFEEENVLIHSSVSANGVDIQIPSLSIGIEIWNWSSNHCYWSRVNDVVRNLSPFKYKILITTFLSERVRQYFNDEGIFVIELGYQLIPRKFLEWYTLNQSMDNKKVSESKRTKRILFNKIFSALLQIGILDNTHNAHVCIPPSNLSSSFAHVCNSLSDSLSNVSFDIVNMMSDSSSNNFNTDKNHIVEGKSSEMTSLSSENRQETTHSINLSRKGRDIVCIFKEEVNMLENQGERNIPKVEENRIFYLKDYVVFFGFTCWELFQLTDRKGYKIKRGKNQKKRFDEALIRLFVTRSMAHYKIQKEIDQLHKKKRTVGLNEEERSRLEKLKKERKHKQTAISSLSRHLEKRHFLVIAEDGRIKAIFKKKTGCRVLTPEDLKIYEHELNPKEITLEEMFDIVFSYHYFHPFAEPIRNPSYIELNSLRKYIKEFYGKRYEVTFKEWREWLRRGKLPRETKHNQSVYGKHHNQPVYGFRRNLDYYLNFNYEYGEIETNNRGNKEMVSLCNNGDDRNEG